MAKGFLDGYQTYDTSKGHGNARKWKEAFSSRMSADEAQQVLSNNSSSPYAILELQDGATAAEVKKAFRRLMMQWHPDRNPDNIQEAEERSREILAAYTLLTS